METIVDRIDRLVKEAVSAGRFRTVSDFWSAEGCGLSRSYLSRFRTRLKTDPDASLTIDTAAKIATALGLSVRDVTGGHDGEPGRTRQDPYPNRTGAIAAARNLQLPESAIRRVLREKPRQDLPRLTWFWQIHAEAERLRPASGG